MKLPTINSYVYRNNISTGYTGHPIGSIAMTLEQCQNPPISRNGKNGENSLFNPVVSPTMPKRYKMKLPTINSYVYRNNISTGYTGHPIGSIAMTLEQC
jgi:hypothetical protein